MDYLGKLIFLDLKVKNTNENHEFAIFGRFLLKRQFYKK